MKIAVSAPPYPHSLEEGLRSIDTFLKEAADAGAEILCFPESFLPGYPLEEEEREKCSAAQLRHAFEKACGMAAEHGVALILPMDWYVGEGFFNVAHVISAKGDWLGFQTKNQLDPSEDNIWQAGTERQVFEINGLKFGISICHEGFRYPETVRWAASRGARVVFHPNLTGSNLHGKEIKEWGHKDNPYYEKAQMVRALENTIYYAPCNYFFLFPESASSVIAPDGSCIVFQKYGEPGIAVADIAPEMATGLLAKRYKSHLYTSVV